MEKLVPIRFCLNFASLCIDSSSLRCLWPHMMVFWESPPPPSLPKELGVLRNWLVPEITSIWPCPIQCFQPAWSHWLNDGGAEPDDWRDFRTTKKKNQPNECQQLTNYPGWIRGDAADEELKQTTHRLWREGICRVICTVRREGSSLKFLLRIPIVII